MDIHASMYIISLSASIIGMLIFGVLVVRSKSLVYSAVYLALTALFAAGIMALLGYTLVAIFQAAVYVGAAVLFIIISVTLIGEPPKPEHRYYNTAIIAGVMSLLALAPITYKALSTLGVEEGVTVKPSLEGVLSLIHTKYYFAVIIAFIAFGALLIEAVVLAKRDKEVETR